jgi:hypothetical protein
MAAYTSQKVSKENFENLYNFAMNEESARIVPIYKQLVDIGLQLNMVYKRRVPAKKVGAHRRNRDGAMVNGREALNLWDQVDLIGVDADLFKDATAFEEPSHKPNEIEFLKLCAADDCLRNYEPGEIEISAVACTHWNQAIAAADAGVVPHIYIYIYIYNYTSVTLTRILCSLASYRLGSLALNL